MVEEGSGRHVGQKKTPLVVLVEAIEEGSLVVQVGWHVLGEPEYKYVFRKGVVRKCFCCHSPTYSVLCLNKIYLLHYTRFLLFS